MSDAPNDDDERYLIHGEGTEPLSASDAQIAELERALRPLATKDVFDAAALPPRASDAAEPPPESQTATVSALRSWGGVAWLAPLASAAVVALWFSGIGRAPEVPTEPLDPNAVPFSVGPPAGVSSSTATSPLSTAPEGPPCGVAADGAGVPYEVLAGAVSCGDRAAPSKGVLAPGVWLSTQDGGRVRLEIAKLGEVDVEPASKIRALATSEKEHRLELARGRLHAIIDAPPRLFFVQTRSAIAIDLGCEYTLSIDDAGNGELSVKTGFVELAAPAAPGFPARATLVPKGASAALLDGRGPGLPIWDREPAEVRAAARRLDADANDEAALDTLLAGLGPRDTLTLVHLVPWVPSHRREQVVAKLHAAAPLPADLRAALVAGDAEAPARLRALFEPRWFPKKSK